MYNPLSKDGLERLKKDHSERFKYCQQNAQYINLKDLEFEDLDGIDVEKLNELARLQRGLIFSMLEESQSGHPGGSSGKVEQFLGMVLGGAMAFDAENPKDTGRDRVVWSAGHCSPGLYSGMSLIYEAMESVGRKNQDKTATAVYARDLMKFRKMAGPQGHIENYYPLSDIATGPSGHGLPSAGGMAMVHKSCGLPFKTWVFMGDAESEEGMTYEARNILSKVGADNLVVSLDYNHFGIDGPIEEVMESPYHNHWLGMGWNMIEINGHNIKEVVYAYNLATQGLGNGLPTVVLAHTWKGKCYGSLENSNKSHGAPIAHDEYVAVMKDLGFDIKGEPGKVWEDMKVVLDQFGDELKKYLLERLEIAKSKIEPEKELVKKMQEKLNGRPLVNPMSLRRPKELPAELQFASGEKVATRKAAAVWFEWLMKNTAFFYTGAGDLSGSIGTNVPENIYGIISKDNPCGRGIRFGIAEQNMAMMSTALTQDKLPGGFQPVSSFGTYAVFTSMMSNAVRLAIIGNHLKPDTAGFFVMLAAHDGPETGEDGPTHQGLYWMSMFNAYPGIKVYKPMDANETIEMLFYALEKGEPIALSLMRPGTPVLDRSLGKSTAKDSTLGAYVFKDYDEESKIKNQELRTKKCLVISGTQVLLNTLEILPELEKKYNIKIVNVSSPELFEDLRKENKKKADEIYSAQDREVAVLIHNGWKGFLYPFLLPVDYTERTIAIDTYLKSGNVQEVYELAGMDSESLKKKILKQ